jgi:hypothetical protein
MVCSTIEIVLPQGQILKSTKAVRVVPHTKAEDERFQDQLQY